MNRVTLIGIGTMGLGMAGRLLEAGYPLTIWNRTPGRADRLLERGAEAADSPREAAAKADVVLSIVSDDAASRAVWTGPDGALAGARPGSALIESSTLSTSWVHSLAEAASSAGCAFLDAPVTGSKTHAAAGQLKFLVGGDEVVLDRVRDVLGAMSREVVYLGPTGSGAFVKLVNNFTCGVQVAAIAEAIAMLERAGLQNDTALDVLLNGGPGSPLVKAVTRRMRERDYDVNFALELMRKDLSYAIAEAAGKGLELETASAALREFELACERGLGERDMAAVVEIERA